MPGWSESIEGVRTFAKLPATAKSYVKRLEELAGVPIRYVGVGRTRDAMIRRGKK